MSRFARAGIFASAVSLSGVSNLQQVFYQTQQVNGPFSIPASSPPWDDTRPWSWFNNASGNPVVGDSRQSSANNYYVRLLQMTGVTAGLFGPGTIMWNKTFGDGVHNDVQLMALSNFGTSDSAVLLLVRDFGNLGIDFGLGTTHFPVYTGMGGDGYGIICLDIDYTGSVQAQTVLSYSSTDGLNNPFTASALGGNCCEIGGSGDTYFAIVVQGRPGHYTWSGGGVTPGCTLFEGPDGTGLTSNSYWSLLYCHMNRPGSSTIGAANFFGWSPVAMGNTISVGDMFRDSTTYVWLTMRAQLFGTTGATSQFVMSDRTVSRSAGQDASCQIIARIEYSTRYPSGIGTVINCSEVVRLSATTQMGNYVRSAMMYDNNGLYGTAGHTYILLATSQQANGATTVTMLATGTSAFTTVIGASVNWHSVAGDFNLYQMFAMYDTTNSQWRWIRNAPQVAGWTSASTPGSPINYTSNAAQIAWTGTRWMVRSGMTYPSGFGYDTDDIWIVDPLAVIQHGSLPSDFGTPLTYPEHSQAYQWDQWQMGELTRPTSAGPSMWCWGLRHYVASGSNELALIKYHEFGQAAMETLWNSDGTINIITGSDISTSTLRAVAMRPNGSKFLVAMKNFNGIAGQITGAFAGKPVGGHIIYEIQAGPPGTTGRGVINWSHFLDVLTGQVFFVYDIHQFDDDSYVMLATLQDPNNLGIEGFHSSITTNASGVSYPVNAALIWGNSSGVTGYKLICSLLSGTKWDGIQLNGHSFVRTGPTSAVVCMELGMGYFNDNGATSNPRIESVMGPHPSVIPGVFNWYYTFVQCNQNGTIGTPKWYEVPSQSNVPSSHQSEQRAVFDGTRVWFPCRSSTIDVSHTVTWDGFSMTFAPATSGGPGGDAKLGSLYVAWNPATGLIERILDFRQYNDPIYLTANPNSKWGWGAIIAPGASVNKIVFLSGGGGGGSTPYSVTYAFGSVTGTHTVTAGSAVYQTDVMTQYDASTNDWDWIHFLGDDPAYATAFSNYGPVQHTTDGGLTYDGVKMAWGVPTGRGVLSSRNVGNPIIRADDDAPHVFEIDTTFNPYMRPIGNGGISINRELVLNNDGYVYLHVVQDVSNVWYPQLRAWKPPIS